MKLIRLYAYLVGNLGDDLMVQELLRRYPDYLFFYNEGSNIRGGENLNNKNFINLNSIYLKFGRLNHILNIVTRNKKKDFIYRWIIKYLNKKTICSVYIGGSLYMQRTGVNVKNEESKLDNGPLFIIGANFGPFEDKSFYLDFYDYFTKCKSVCFRDNYSYQLFSNISHVRVAPDVVLNRPRCKQNESIDQIILISVIDFTSRKNLSQFSNDYIEFIKMICKETVNRKLTPVLASFCKIEGDEKAVKYIYDSLDDNTKKMTKAFCYSNIEEVNNLLRNCCFIVATRFHAMILAIKNEIPFFCVSYDNKSINVLRDIGIESYCLPKDIHNLDIQRILDEKINFENAREYANNACLQFADLDAFLGLE